MIAPTATGSLYHRGDVVILPFPGSAPGAPAKRRPAAVLAAVSYGSGTDYLCALITSQAAPDPARITLAPADVQGGALIVQSYLRPLYLYTASERLIVGKIGVLAPTKLAEAVRSLKLLIDPPSTEP